MNFIFEHFSKICGENENLIKIGQEKRVLYIKAIYVFDHISLSSPIQKATHI
jgi:hypothetical protein